MAFEPKTWETGDVITAENFNSVSPYIGELTISEDEETSDVTFTTHETAGQIFEAVQSGRPCIFINATIEEGLADYAYYMLLDMSLSGGTYTAYIVILYFEDLQPTLKVVKLSSSSENDPLVYSIES